MRVRTASYSRREGKERVIYKRGDIIDVEQEEVQRHFGTFGHLSEGKTLPPESARENIEPSTPEVVFRKGDRVIATIDEEDYAGEITKVSRKNREAIVAFEDGDTDNVSFDNLRHASDEDDEGNEE